MSFTLCFPLKALTRLLKFKLHEQIINSEFFKVATMEYGSTVSSASGKRGLI